MTRLVYSGAEVGSNRVLLTDMGVRHIGVSYWRLLKRGLPTTKKYLFAEKVPEGTQVYLYPGTVTDKDVDLDEFALGYLEFVKDNLAVLGGVLEVTVTRDTPGAQAAHQRLLLDVVGEERAWALWEPGKGSLDSLAQRFANVALRGDTLTVDASLPGRLRALQGLYGTRWHALAFAQPDEIRSLPLDNVLTHAWLAPMLRGETVMWEVNRLVRYPQKMKDRARARAAAVTQRAGLDLDKIQADDPNENARLAIWSYQQLEKSLLRSDQSEWADDPGDAETGGSDPDHSDLAVRNALPVELRPVDERMVLPVVGFKTQQVVEKDENGQDVVRDAPIVESTNGTIRQCNTCVVAANCPAVKPNSTCAFELPVRVQTKDQLKALLSTLIEIQGTRVLFGRFAEELNGGYPDENVSKEMDRFFRMVKTTKELEDNREFIRMTVERQGQGGVLSAIFGDRAQALRELPAGGLTPDQTDKVIEQGPDALK